MMAGDVHAVIQVEPMGGKALHAGVQVKLFAALFQRVLLQPFEQRTARASRSGSSSSDQVIYIEMSTPGQLGADDETGHGQWRLVPAGNRQLVVLLKLLPHAICKFCGGELRAEFAEKAARCCDVVSRASQADIVCGCHWIRALVSVSMGATPGLGIALRRRLQEAVVRPASRARVRDVMAIPCVQDHVFGSYGAAFVLHGANRAGTAPVG